MSYEAVMFNRWGRVLDSESTPKYEGIFACIRLTRVLTHTHIPKSKHISTASEYAFLTKIPSVLKHSKFEKFWLSSDKINR